MRSNSSSNLRVDNAFLNMKAALDKENNEAISKARASSINLLIKPQGFLEYYWKLMYKQESLYQIENLWIQRLGNN